ncbi:CD225/dispanin family protein [Luteimonas sp. XNQY3]|nr:CD225/dispanin family protein [Luteimonas sp. XNQY3]MCD9007711.1 CD225/dispanin family protein [Luteimonas sp. XNQY3]
MSSIPPPPGSYGTPEAPLPGSPIAPGTVPNHLAWSIVGTVLGFCLCCLIGAVPGIVALVFSSKVNTLLGQGDLAGAQRASNTAKTWCIVATVLAAIGLLLNVLSFFTGGTEQYQMLLEQLQNAS